MTKLPDHLQNLHRKIQGIATDAERQKLYVVLDGRLQQQFPDTAPGRFHYSLIPRPDGVYLQIDRKRRRAAEVQKISKSDQPA